MSDGSDGPAGAGTPDAFVVRDSRVTHEGVMMTVRVDSVEMPDGSVAEREVALRPNAVAVVPLTADGDVVLVRQYRHAVGRYELEIPAGLLDVAGEDERDAAARELTEETGLTAGWMRPALRFHNSAGWTAETTTVFVARDLTDGTPDDGFEPTAEEADMDVVRVPVGHAVAMVRDGTIRDAKTVIGLLLATHGGPTAP